MRRGLMHWSQAEMPAEVLAQRVQRLQQAMSPQGLEAVLAWTNFAQPAVVHWLTHFTPYWSEAVLAVPARGPVVLLAALTPRVHDWIRSVCRVDRVVAAPRLGEAVARWLDEAVPDRAARIGVVGLEAAPWPVLQPVLQGRGAGVLVDAAGLYRGIRQPADTAELGLARRAQAIGQAAWDAVTPGLRDTAGLTSRVEAAARLAGAEELLLRVAPDLARSTVAVRPEPVLPLGPHYAVEMSIAYKGAWVRLARSIVRDGGAEPAAWAAARVFFDRLARGAWASAGSPPEPPPGLRLQHWQLEASVDAWPLACAAQHPGGAASALPPGSLAVLSARIATAQGGWNGATPVVVTATGLHALDATA